MGRRQSVLLLLIACIAQRTPSTAGGLSTEIFSDSKCCGVNKLGRRTCRSACWRQLEKNLREVIWQQRKFIGQLHCQLHGIGPTGGFCLSPTQPFVGGNEIFDSLLGAALVRLFRNHSVLDLGCGLGHYGHYLGSASDAGISWAGYDGSEGIEEATKGFVKFVDLSRPNWLGRQFDFVMSLEVGEHLPRQFETEFVNNLVRHARKGIVLSWAVPGQTGHHHVNSRPQAYVIQLLESRGFRFSTAETRVLRRAARQRWCG